VREGKTNATGTSREEYHWDQVVSLPDDNDLFLGWFMGGQSDLAGTNE